MKINYDKLFKPDDVEIKEDVSNIDSIMEFEEVLFAISETIINYRKEHNLTQKQLAKILGVNQSMIVKLEKGDYNPTFKKIYEISKKLNNNTDIFIEILDNIKEKLNHLLIQEYNMKVDLKEIEQSYFAGETQNDNVIEFKYSESMGGTLKYEECTSSISNVG